MDERFAPESSTACFFAFNGVYLCIANQRPPKTSHISSYFNVVTAEPSAYYTFILHPFSVLETGEEVKESMI